MGQARRGGLVRHVVLAAAAYIPLALSGRGLVNADTKSYLYLDPGRLLSRAATLWDPNIGMGTVSHQIVGYLWPMGPYFWLAEAAGLPDWLAQRLWLGSILFAAGAGVLFLGRLLGLRGIGAFTAAAVYMLSPYLLAFGARISALLLPWAALPWLMGFMILALRRRGWRWPAAFALLTTTVGSINASSLLFVIVGAGLIVPYAVFVTRDIRVRPALATLARTGGLTVLVNLWWVVALVIGGGFGVPVLQATETVEAVSRSSTATEVLRGLGNWFFYGTDRLGPWVQASVPYQESPVLIAVSFALPVLALLAAAFVGWRHRGLFVLLIVTGTVVAVGAYPYTDPSFYGRGLKALADGSTIGMALRNAPRATPLVTLGMAVLLGAGVAAVARRLPRAGVAAAVLATGLAAANLPALWAGDLVDPNLSRAEALPSWWAEAAAYLDARDDGTRVLEIPGADFAAYRWGNTIDPVTPGLMDRPYVARESLPIGSIASVNLLTAFDRRLQEGVFEPAAVAPMARLMAAGDLVLRSDLQFERYRTPRPRPTWQRLTPPPPGLGDPATFGPATPNRPIPQYPMVDEVALAVPPGAPHPPKVAVFPVAGARPIVRAAPDAGQLVVAGDGEGVVELAAAGLLDVDRVLRYAGTMSEEEIAGALAAAGEVVVTDSNRRRAQRWTIVRENYGYTERAGEQPLRPDPSDGRFVLFPGAGDGAYTVAQHRGVSRVAATGYGNVVSYTPEDRAVLALDGDPRTDWRVGGFADPRGERLEVDLLDPVTTDRIRLVQPLIGARNRWITQARLRFDGTDTLDVVLDERSRTEAGQTVRFPPRTFTRIEFEIAGTNVGRLPDYDGYSSVGLAELDIEGVTAEELIRLPERVLDLAAGALADRPLTLVLARARANPAEPVRADEERSLRRSFRLPEGRRFTLAGTARLSAERDDATLDHLLGMRGRVRAQSNARLPGDTRSRASKAFDGDPTTAWQPGLLAQEGKAIELHLPQPRTIDRMDLTLVADGRHSVPTELTLSDGERQLRVAVPDVTDGDVEGATRTVPLRFEPVRTADLTITVSGVRPVTALDYYTGEPSVLPVAIAEAGVPGVHIPAPPEHLPGDCRSDLATIDEQPVSLRITGTTAAAEGREGLGVELCGPSAAGLDLNGGEHVLRTQPGLATGFDIDRLVLRSVPAGWAPPPASAPAVEVTRPGRSSREVTVRGATPGEPFWLVLGESFNEGWHASVNGRSLGPPQLVDGYANGWRITPGESTFTVGLTWQPQRAQTVALYASAAAGLLCLALVAAGSGAWWRRDRSRRDRSRRGRARSGSSPAGAGGVLEPVSPALAPALPAAIDGRRRLLWVPVLTAGVGGVVAPLGSAMVAGAVVAVAVAAGPRLRQVVLLAPAALAAAAGAYVVLLQARYGYPAEFSWAGHFHRAHPVAWAAVLSLAGLAGLEVAARRRPAVSSDHPGRGA